MWSGNLVSGPGFAFIINGGHSLIGGGDYFEHFRASATEQPARPGTLKEARPSLGGVAGSGLCINPDGYLHVSQSAKGLLG